MNFFNFMNLFIKIISRFPYFYKLVYSKFYKKPNNGHGTHVPALNKILDFLWCEKKRLFNRLRVWNRTIFY